MKRIAAILVSVASLLCACLTASSGQPKAAETALAVNRAHLNSARHEVMSTRMVLELLRQNKTDEAIELLETQLDLAVVLTDKFDRKAEARDRGTTRIILQRAKQYRDKHPRQVSEPKPTENPELDRVMASGVKDMTEKARKVLSTIKVEDAEQSPPAYPSKAADGLTGNAEE